MIRKELIKFLECFAGNETMSNSADLIKIVDAYLRDEKIAINLKNNEKYIIIKDHIINTTNSNKNEIMILYEKSEKLFVREKSEFLKKFKIIND